MTVFDLANRLSTMYTSAAKGESVVMIHLFGIKYASEIRTLNVPIKRIVELAKLPESYATEVSKGIKLAGHVVIK